MPHALPEVLAAGRTILAEAMQATLPGIDANDPPKTLATLQLYYSVLSSIGRIGEPGDADTGHHEVGGALPMDWSMWVDDLLSRLLVLLTHLDASGKESSSE